MSNLRMPSAGPRMSLGSRNLLAGLLLLAVSASMGCWEQMSAEWFPQMKRQRATQAFEVVTYKDQLQGFSPPEGTVPMGWGAVPNLLNMDEVQRNAVPNPVTPNLASLKRGEQLFEHSAALVQLLDDAACVLFVAVGHALLVRLLHLAVPLAADDPRPAHRQLVSLAAHGLDEDGAVQRPAAAGVERRFLELVLVALLREGGCRHQKQE